MKPNKALKVGFLDLPVKSRNIVTTLFTNIKADLKKWCLLEDLDLNAVCWDDVGLTQFLQFPKEHYLQIINRGHKEDDFKSNLIKQVNSVYTIFAKTSRARKFNEVKFENQEILDSFYFESNTCKNSFKS